MINLTIKRNLSRNLLNLLGWSCKKRIIVIESDDWGSIRMPSLKSFRYLEAKGIDLRSHDSERYNLYDSLATSVDLELLFELLAHFTDNHGSNAVVTPAVVVANPDFIKIKDSNFNEYFYEPFTTTLKRYPGCDNSFKLWKEGIEKKIFVPQMHGREHLNVTSWMYDLKHGDLDTHLAFNEGFWGFVKNTFPETDYQAAFLFAKPNEIEFHKEIITKGLLLFEELFGYKAEYFVPPNGILSNKLNTTLATNGIKYNLTSRLQEEPLGNGKYKRAFHWLGQLDQSGLRYITRNCFFEPSQPGYDWVDRCLQDIKLAFRYKKPAVISTHRVNYIGALYPKNRDNGLTQLKLLLKNILKNWPDVYFMTTAELGDLIEHDLLV